MNAPLSIRILGIFILACACLFLIGTTYGQTPNHYVGVKMCKMCHSMDKTGNQFAVWSKSKHAEAYASLLTPRADSIAKVRGSKTSAVKTQACLDCHTVTAKADLFDKTFDVKDGVQCEVCHGPGSSYKSITIMKDKAKATAAGMTDYKDDAAITAACTKCHNDKSPYYTGFKFAEMWPKIKHTVPK